MASKCAFRNFGEQLIMIVVESENAKLDNFGWNEFKQLGQTLFRDFPA